MPTVPDPLITARSLGASGSPDPGAAFDALVHELSHVPGVDPPGSDRGFGSGALKTAGSIFAMLSRGRLVVKLPRDRVAALIDSGAGAGFDAGKARPMKEWVVVLDEGAWSALATEALAFVSSAGRRSRR